MRRLCSSCEQSKDAGGRSGRYEGRDPGVAGDAEEAWNPYTTCFEAVRMLCFAEVRVGVDGMFDNTFCLSAGVLREMIEFIR